LPRAEEALIKDRPTQPVEGRPTILVVEDEPLVLMFVAEELSALGYHVLTAGNADKALELVRGTQKIDVLFSDIVMPGSMNGVQLSVEARRIRSTLKVLLATGNAPAFVTGDIHVDNEILPKPYQPDELARRLRKLMNCA
jgi:CheY-like chemotaxis protein